MICRGVVDASRCIIRLNRPSFIWNSSCENIAAADDDRLAGHVGIRVAEQNGDPAGDLIGLGIALERRMGCKLAAGSPRPLPFLWQCRRERWR